MEGGGGITYPFPNFNGATIEVWERINDSPNNLLGVLLLIRVEIKVDPY